MTTWPHTIHADRVLVTVTLHGMAPDNLHSPLSVAAELASEHLARFGLGTLGFGQRDEIGVYTGRGTPPGGHSTRRVYAWSIVPPPVNLAKKPRPPRDVTPWADGTAAPMADAPRGRRRRSSDGTGAIVAGMTGLALGGSDD
jgi:hypothetical protein